MSSLSPAAQPASARSATCEIWIRSKGSRRQAFYRQDGAGAWRGMQVIAAERALRAGHLSIGLLDLPVVPRETDAAEHPLQAAFSVQAKALNEAIDALNVEARGAA